MGSSYVANKFAYEAVDAQAITTYAGTIPSGASIVQGIYYMWDDGGFTGNGWMYNVLGGPTNTYPGFNSDTDVAEYVGTYENLDAVFAHWASNYTMEGWNAFYMAVGFDSGCMDVDHVDA